MSGGLHQAETSDEFSNIFFWSCFDRYGVASEVLIWFVRKEKAGCKM
jgi:hypothetical protein